MSDPIDELVVSRKVLTEQLKDMEKSSILLWKGFSKVPPPGGIFIDRKGPQPAIHAKYMLCEWN